MYVCPSGMKFIYYICNISVNYHPTPWVLKLTTIYMSYVNVVVLGN